MFVFDSGQKMTIGGGGSQGVTGGVTMAVGMSGDGVEKGHVGGPRHDS